MNYGWEQFSEDMKIIRDVWVLYYNGNPIGEKSLIRFEGAVQRLDEFQQQVYKELGVS